jgi:5-formyltetrahydrofolate cyclo-ligase
MGILEPDSCSPEVFPDIVLVPLLAFDERGNRLGYGAGHYDTTFSKRKALMIGVGFEVQKINDVPAESHDVKMDIVITEKGVYRT